MRDVSWPDLPLPAGVRSRHVAGVNGLDMHLLQAGDPAAPCVLLLHGFPELAYSWRHLMPLLADAGFCVIAPDQRGYGRTTGWASGYDAPLEPFGLINLGRDAVALLDALRIERAAAVVGHDFGAPVAAWCALLWPQRFARVALMSAPFAGPPPATARSSHDVAAELDAALAALSPPRKHYQSHYRTRGADAEMRHDLSAFLRAYFHMKSADWPGNRPHALPDASAASLAQMPGYYVMDLQRSMSETVAEHAPTPEQAATCRWLTDADLAVYAAEYSRTGFQGGLQWYRCSIDAGCFAQLQRHAGQRIEIPACFIAGASDWGTFQRPGEWQRMPAACAQWRGSHVIDGAGHWVQQERSAHTAQALLHFMRDEAGFLQ